MKGERSIKTPRKASAIPGGGSGKNSAWKFKGPGGYKSPKETASLKGGLTYGTTCHPYDGKGADQPQANGTSIFDPVLCELVYRWFSPQAGAVLDPFAGGSVRGVVASVLGRQYTGVDLSGRQINANRTQWLEIEAKALAGRDKPTPRWIEGDSRNLGDLAPGEYDLLFSCPPYAHLEVYSEDPADLSQMDYADFKVAYQSIIHAGLTMLKPDRFACFVVGEVRGKDGYYLNLVGDTVNTFLNFPGVRLYNEAVLVTAIGSLPIRVGAQFTGGRKLGKTHQNILVFVKGDWRKAAAACGALEQNDFGEITAPIDDDLPSA